ncbi:hypothetical protein NMG60_11024311 [Bertholletia excelsa]
MLSNSEFREVFKHLDRDSDGKISGDELRAYFEDAGEPISLEGTRKAIAEFDVDGDGTLGFGEFVHMMRRNDSGDDGDLRRAFEVFEVEKGSGRITPRGLKRVLDRLGETQSVEECKAMIRAFDVKGNGWLDFEGFERMMTTERCMA